MSLRVIAFAFLFSLSLTSFNVEAQNPPVAACGLPAGGFIAVSTTYTLTADCVQTGFLEFQLANGTLTINGGGFTVTGPENFVFLRVLNSTVTAEVNQLTVDGNGDAGGAGMVNTTGTVVLNQVTLTRAVGGPALAIGGTGSATLNNVLVERNILNVHRANANASAIHVASGGSVALNDVVIRRNITGGGAVTVLGTGSFTAEGCLSLSGNAPIDIRGDWTDNSTGRCSGAIGNGDQVEPATPALQTCGLPISGVLDESATFTLSGDCVWNGRTIVSENVEITINGNAHTISSANASYTLWIASTASLTFNNVALDSLRVWNYGTLRGNDTVTSGASEVRYVNVGSMQYSNSLFEDNVATGGYSVYFGWSAYNSGVVSFTDTVMRNNTSTTAALVRSGAGTAIEFFGCLTFENNVPANVNGTYTDNSTGPCPDTFEPLTPEEQPAVIQPLQEPAGPRSAGAEVEAESEPVRACFQQLGSIGVICRREDGGGALEVWRLDASGNGSLALYLPYAVVDSHGSQGMVATSLEGRLRVQLIGPECVKRDGNGNNPRVVSAECIGNQLTWLSAAGPQPLGDERYVAISMGPSPGGKTHHVVFDHNVAGHVIGTVDTHGALPPIAATSADEESANATRPSAPFVQSQPALADGSIVHVVQPADTVYAIALAYGVSPAAIIERNGLADRGNRIAVGQVLVIRDA